MVGQKIVAGAGAPSVQARIRGHGEGTQPLCERWAQRFDLVTRNASDWPSSHAKNLGDAGRSLLKQASNRWLGPTDASCVQTSIELAAVR